MSTATVTSKGQVTIPKDVRDRMGLKPGDKIVFLRNSDEDVLLQRKRPITELFGCIPYDGPPLSTEDMDQAIGDAVADKHDLK